MLKILSKRKPIKRLIVPNYTPNMLERVANHIFWILHKDVDCPPNIDFENQNKASQMAYDMLYEQNLTKYYQRMIRGQV